MGVAVCYESSMSHKVFFVRLHLLGALTTKLRIPLSRREGLVRHDV